jgi:hypothetical protein
MEDMAGQQFASRYDAEWGKGFIKGKDFVTTIAGELQGASK